MKLGALIGPVNPAEPGSLAQQAEQLEKLGYQSLWSAHATGRGFMVADPFVALTVAATATRDVELGTAILQLPLYEPADVALKSYTLMQVSGNRFTLGVGAGSTEVDHRLHHSPFGARFRQFNQKLATLRDIFTAGEYDGIPLTPWPGVKAPELIYGTWGNGVARAANEFEAWIGSGMHRGPDELETAIAGYREAGGKRAIVTTIVLSAETDPVALKLLLDRYAQAGFDDAVVMYLPGAPDPGQVRDMVS